MADETPNHELNTYNPGEEGWEHSTDMSTIEERLPIRDDVGFLGDYEPHLGAVYIATNNEVYDGDGANWVHAERNFARLTVDGLEVATETYTDDRVQTVSDNLADHENDTTNPHEITASDVDAVDQQAIDDHAAETLNVHGAGESGVASNADVDSALSGHESAVAVHGVSEVAGTSDVDAVASDLSTHENDTENPHFVDAADVGSPTQSEFDSHTGNDNAHHARYADSEAQAAVDGADVDILGDAGSVNGYEIQKDGTDGAGIINFKTV